MDFRQFLENGKSSGSCVVVSEEINSREIPMRINAEDQAENRMLIFENVSDFSGSVASNLFGSPKRIFKAVGAHDGASFYAKIDQATQSPQTLNIQARDSDDYEVIKDPVLLDQIPNIVHSEHDATVYITSGVALAKNPETGKHHLSFVRLSVQDGNRFFFNPRTPRMKEIAELTIYQGKPLDIAVLISGPVEAMLLGTLGCSPADDELEMAQALGGDDLAFSDGELPVPLGTEMVMFGTVEPEYGDEGPFGDMKGLYMTNENPFCRVTEMWRRKDVKYHSILGGKSQEHVGLVRLKMQHQLEHLKAKTPYILDYYLPKYAAGQMCILTVEDGYTLADMDQSLFNISLIDKFVLVNKDTDAKLPEDILWAITQRASGDNDFIFVQSEDIFGRPGFSIIDATVADTKAWKNIRVNVFE